MSRPLLLDLFCGAGGVAMGYHKAGFDIFGIDINPQPNYPFQFIQHDALEILSLLPRFERYNTKQTIAVIHASPPCQAFTSMKNMPDARTHPRLIAPVRDLLIATKRPYVIENVVGAPLKNPILLCGSMFGLETDGFQLRRHRLFESNVDINPPTTCQHTSPTIGIYGGHVRCRSRQYWRDGGADFPGYNKKQLAMNAMKIEHHMTMNELSEAIPPSYTKHIGHQLRSQL